MKITEAELTKWEASLEALPGKLSTPPTRDEAEALGRFVSDASTAMPQLIAGVRLLSGIVRDMAALECRPQGNDSDPSCPSCWRTEDEGHSDECLIRRAGEAIR
jgi:hypothetical protein